MEILYLLIPLSTLLVLLIIVVFGWALHSGQFEDLEREGERVLQDDDAALDEGQTPPSGGPKNAGWKKALAGGK